MKQILFFSLLACTHFGFGQVIKEGLREDGCYEYWASLDDYNAPIQFPIRVEQIDGQSAKLIGQTALKGKKATLIIRNKNTNKIDSIQVPENGVFELIVSKNIELTMNLSGFVSYTNDQLKLDNLSMLVLKMHPLPEDDIYLIIFKKPISSEALEKMLACLAKTKNSGTNANCQHPELIRIETR